MVAAGERDEKNVNMVAAVDRESETRRMSTWW